MIHVVNTLRANIIRREVEDKVLTVVMPKRDRWGRGAIHTPRLFMVARMVRRFERIRMQRWALWKDRR